VTAAEEVSEAISAYDVALKDGDLAIVDSWFLDSGLASRFGVDEVAYGAAAIAASRRESRAAPVARGERVDGRRELIVLGDDVVVATLEHRQRGENSRRRRTQVWWRIEPGVWRIAHAHLSIER